MTGGGFLAGAITAKLILDKSGWNSSVQSVVKDGQKLVGMSGTVASGFKTAGSVMMVAGGAIVGALMSCVKEAGEADRTIRQLNTVLASTKGVAGITATEAIKLSEALQKDSSYSHDLILEGENLLLTFTNIGKDTFPEATKVMLDMSVALGQDLKGSAIQLGKALQDPVMGVTALRRVGVNFTKEQRELIKVLVESGHSLDAQKIILKELSTEFGGSALATTKGFGGQCKQLKMDLDDVREEIGRAVLPILKDLVAAVRPVIQNILTWIEQNPELVRQIAGLAMKAGLLMLVLGPISYMVPKIVGLFGSLAGAGKSLGGAILNLNKPITSSGNLLGKVALVGTAAFVGWKIGRLIGEMTGLDKVIEGVFDKAFKLLGIIKEHNVEMGLGHAPAYAKQQEAIGLASELAGHKVKSIQEALDILSEQYKKTGTTGSASLDVLVKSHDAAGVAVAKHKETQAGLHGVSKEAEGDGYGLARSLLEQKTAQEALTEYMSSAGIPTMKERDEAINNALLALKALKGAQDEHRIGEEKAKEIQADLNTKLWDYGYYMKTALPPSRNMRDLMITMPKELGSTAYAFGTLDDKLDSMAYEMGMSTTTLKAYIYELQRMQLAIIGIHLPPFPGWPKDEITTKVVDPVSEAFAGLYNNIAQGFGDTFKTFVETWSVDKLLKMDIDFKEFFKNLWGNIKDSFFTMIGEIATKWIKGFLEDTLLKKTKETATGVVDSVKGMAETATSAAGSIGTALGSLGTGLATIITAITSAVATGIVTIATGIASAIVALATGIATAATILAAAAPALLIVGGIALAIFAGFKAIEALFGGGGGKQTDVTYWLKLMWADGKELHDWVINLPEAYLNNFHNFFVNTETATRETVNVLYAIKDFLGPMLGALQSIDSQLSKLPHGAAGALIEQPTLMVAGENAPSVPEILLPIPGLKAALGAAAAGGGGAGATQIILAANFNVNCLDSEDMQDVVRKKIGPQFIEMIRSNIGKRELQEALGV